MGKLVIIGLLIGVLVSLGFTGDYLLKEYLDIGLIDGLAVLMENSITKEAAMSFDQVTPELIGAELYTSLLDDKEFVDNGLIYAEQALEIINNNPEVTETIKDVLGSEYSIYVFSVKEFNGTTFKVLEITVKEVDGLISTLEQGMTLDKYNVRIELDHSVIPLIMNGNVNSDVIINWVSEGKLKVNPITEALKAQQVMPVIIENLII